MNEINSTINDNEETYILSTSTAFVYVLGRAKHLNVSKVGFTNVSAKSRANSYTDGDWEIYQEFPMPIYLARLTERAAHLQLSEYWFDPKITGGTANEIFMCSPDVASVAVQIAKDEAQKIILSSLGLPKNTHDLLKNSINTRDSEKTTEIINELNRKINDLENTISFYKANRNKSEAYLEDELRKANLYYSRQVSSLEEENKNFKKLSLPKDIESKISIQPQENQASSQEEKYLKNTIAKLESEHKKLLNPILSELEISYEELQNISRNLQNNSNAKIKYKFLEAIELATKYRKLFEMKDEKKRI